MGQVCTCFAGLRHRRCVAERSVDDLVDRRSLAVDDLAPLVATEVARPLREAAASAGANGLGAGGASSPGAGSGSRAARAAKAKPRSTKVPVPLEEDSGSSDYEFPVAPLGPDGLPSVGSKGHDTGDCKRCCFYPKGRCANEHGCRFCHFDHDKRKRLKKKKKSRSELPTPHSVTGGMAAGFAMATPSGGMVTMPGTPLTPMGFALPSSPSRPPATAPQVSGLRAKEPPPPPASAPQSVPGGASEGTSPEPTALTGTPAGITGKPLTIADLTSPAKDRDGGRSPLWPAPTAPAAAGTPAASTAPGVPPAGWPGGYQPNPYAGMPPQWAAYYAAMAQSQLAYSAALYGRGPGGPGVPGAPGAPGAPGSPGAHAKAAAEVLGLSGPPPAPATPGRKDRAGAAPPALSPAQTGRQGPAGGGGMEKDSPRSVVLTLCGAWGALKTPTKETPTKAPAEAALGEDEGAAQSPAAASSPAPSPSAPSPEPPETPGSISRQSLLGLRGKRGKKQPAELQSLRAFDVQ